MNARAIGGLLSDSNDFANHDFAKMHSRRIALAANSLILFGKIMVDKIINAIEKGHSFWNLKMRCREFWET